MSPGQSLLFGIIVVCAYCVLATGADALVKIVAQGFAAPQFFAISGLLVATMSLGVTRIPGASRRLRPHRPWLLSFRSLLVLISSVSYYYAFALLPFAEVFVFIALVPLVAALVSGPFLGEPVRMSSWLALIAGTMGVVVMFANSYSSVQLGHIAALIGVVSGAISMVLARLISRTDTNSLLQVLYPNLIMGGLMLLVVPSVYRAMGWTDLGLIALYAVLLFCARWLLVLALTHLKAYVATPLLNLQFVFMVIVGWVLFDEPATVSLILGATIIMAAGSYLTFEQVLAARASTKDMDAIQALAANAHKPGMPSVSGYKRHSARARGTDKQIALRRSDM